ncbi:MAG: amino acid ABC transporter substrate-binding protein [Spirochaetales bacterium]|nr:amino acid ABC transporter substrate-binding protein [Spirochaetales bacterium]
MKKAGLLVALLAAGAMVFAGGSKESKSSGDQSLSKVLEAKRFVLGLDDSFPPMGFRNEKNEIVGFDIDVAREVCNRLGVDLVPQPIDWNSKEQELNTGKIDCIWNGFTITDERKANMEFSDPYVNNAQVVVVKADSPVKTLADLAGKEIGVQAGSSAEEAIDDTPNFKNSVKQIVEYKENLTALMDLEAGGVDGVVMDLIVANDNINRSGKPFRILDENLAPESYGVGFRKGDVALRNAVNDQMIAMAKDGTMAKIAEKWFGADITVIGK